MAIGHRHHVLSLYKQILTVAKSLPGKNRQNLVKRKAREGFRQHQSESRQEEIDLHVRLAETQLETLRIQAEQLSNIFKNPKSFVV